MLGAQACQSNYCVIFRSSLLPNDFYSVFTCLLWIHIANWFSELWFTCFFQMIMSMLAQHCWCRSTRPTPIPHNLSDKICSRCYSSCGEHLGWLDSAYLPVATAPVPSFTLVLAGPRLASGPGVGCSLTPWGCWTSTTPLKSQPLASWTQLLVFGFLQLNLSPVTSDVYTLVRSIKYSLIVKLITQMRTKRRDEFIKPN